MQLLPDSAKLSALDLTHEEDVIRRPYVLKAWLRYLEAKQKAAPRDRFILYERALKCLPGSYKLWYAYLNERISHASTLHPDHPAHKTLLDVFDRSLLFLRRMPVIWHLYFKTLLSQCRYKKCHKVLDEALRALPVTQHEGVWKYYRELVKAVDIPKLGVKVLKRFCKVFPEQGREDLFQYLVNAQAYDEAALVLAQALADPTWTAQHASRQELWTKLVHLAVDHSVTSLDVDAIIRTGIHNTKTEVAESWVALADYYAGRGIMEKSRDVYEEAMTSVLTVRDFTIVFDAYATFLEEIATAKMQEQEDLTTSKNINSKDKDDLQILLDIFLCRLEDLTERRPILLSSVLLRQNPHNVHEWHKRARIYLENQDLAGAVDVYTDAVKTVDPWRATNGRPHTLWLTFARLYEDHGDLDSARSVLDRAVQWPKKFKTPEDLAAVWCEYAEMELRANDPKRAIQVLKRATTPPLLSSKNVKIKHFHKDRTEAVLGAGAGHVEIGFDYDSNEAPAAKAWRSPRLWGFLIDLMESVMGVKETLSVYELMLENKVATVQSLLNGASYLESHQYYENAFKLYERGVSLFHWPAVFAIWAKYLQRFVERYGARKLERARDLFEEAIKQVPNEDPNTKELYLMYADMEEKYGLLRHAMTIYARVVSVVPKSERSLLYKIYIAKAAEYFGVTKTRSIYREAIENASDRVMVVNFSQRFAEMETRLGEIDRARAIYAHGAQAADPKGGPRFEKYWQSWNDFELAHGSEDTFSEMLRVKRSVQMQYSQFYVVLGANANKTSIVTAAGGAVGTSEQTNVGSASAIDSTHVPANIEELERLVEAEATAQAVQKNNDTDGVEQNPEVVVEERDHEEIEEEEKEETKKNISGIVEKEIPVAVFGGITQEKKDDGEPMGALARLKRKKG